jgi:hypothetical protein
VGAVPLNTTATRVTAAAAIHIAPALRPVAVPPDVPAQP